LSVLALLLHVAFGSSHSEAPSTAVAAGADITDFYMFRSYEEGGVDAVTFIINSSPLQSPFAGPNYYGFSPAHFYQLHLTTGCVEEHVFSFYFGANLGGATGTVEEYDFNGCTHNYTINSITSEEGVTIDVKNADNTVNTTQFIPLKALGLFTAGPNVDGQNYFEYFHVDYSTSSTGFPRDSLAVDLEIPYPNVGSNTFSLDTYEAYLAQNEGFVHDVDLTPFCAATGRVFAGQRADSFSVNLGRIFDRLNMNPIPGFPSSVVDDDTNNLLSDKNVQTIALEIPLACITAISDNGVIGGWATTSELYHDALDNHLVGAQFSRLGNPLVNEVAIGLKDKQLFSISPPSGDAAFANYVLYPSLPAIIDAVFLGFVQENVAGASGLTNLAPTNLPRVDLSLIFLNGLPNLNSPTVNGCELMRLNSTVSPTAFEAQENMGVLALDVAGYPNGRRPGDDVVDISLRAMMGVMCTNCEVFGTALGLDVCTAIGCADPATTAPVGGVNFLDGAPQNAAQFTEAFPYLNIPHSGETVNVVQSDLDGGRSDSSASSLEWIF
jgi:hypothetical protein